ncbi:MAG: cyclic nucleotide-binding domain-containing protein [Acidobacteriota bacterium]|nr:cyclic nucleotide-binding domain-containing protein [Blastocatellia bacterium]MDW8241400.1 cyclic nucleotide-binding domain-containing protein [Acidobacteriota bacterium]
METLERILSEHPFLKGLAPEYIQLIVGCAANVRFEAGQFIFREGEEANQFYVIRQGRVALSMFTPERGPIVIETLGEGDILGWSWLVPPYHWRFNAQAMELTRAIALDGKCLRGKCESDHDLGFELLKRFAHIIEQRLQATRLQLLDVYGARS